MNRVSSGVFQATRKTALKLVITPCLIPNSSQHKEHLRPCTSVQLVEVPKSACKQVDFRAALFSHSSSHHHLHRSQGCITCLQLTLGNPGSFSFFLLLQRTFAKQGWLCCQATHQQKGSLLIRVHTNTSLKL